MDERKHAVKVSEATLNQKKEVTSFLGIFLVSIQRGKNRVNSYAFLDSGSTVSFIYQCLEDKLRAQDTDFTLNMACIQGTNDLKRKKFPINLRRPLNRTLQLIEAFEHPSIPLGNTNYD